MHPHTLIMTARIALEVSIKVGEAPIPTIVETTLREMWRRERLYLHYKNGPATLFRTLSAVIQTLVEKSGKLCAEYDRLVQEKELLELDTPSIQKIIFNIAQQLTKKG